MPMAAAYTPSCGLAHIHSHAPRALKEGSNAKVRELATRPPRIVEIIDNASGVFGRDPRRV